MADSIKNGSFENDSNEETSPKVGLSTSFTISFEDVNGRTPFKQKKIVKTTNLFVRRHVRTLSLPVNNGCLENDIKCSERSIDNGNNISFHNQTTKSYSASKEKGVNTTNKKNHVEDDSLLQFTELKEFPAVNGKKNDAIASDSDSEGGTYTLDTDNKDVQIARKTIDQVFGISSALQKDENNVIPEEKKLNKTRMIDEWIENSASAIRISNDIQKTRSVTMNCSLKKSYVSKIPSPVFSRRELNVKGAVNSCLNKKVQSIDYVKMKDPDVAELKVIQKSVTSPVNGDIDTDSYLKETENIVFTLQNRLHSNIKEVEASEKESPTSKYSNTRLNRAFSLRRERLNKPSPVITNTAIPIRAKISQGKPTSTSHLISESNGHVLSSPDIKNSVSKELNKLKNCTSVTTSSSKMRDHYKPEDLKKKTYQRLKTTGNSFRSNSSLSSQEIEFQNWKRRKSYDPLKAAAEDRKKKSMMQSETVSASVSTASLMKKQTSANQNENENATEKGIMRSASFHGLRNKNGYDQSINDNCMNRSANSKFISSSCLSKENSRFSDFVDDDDNENEWPVPKPPSTSLQNTPPESISSRLSLLSHAMSNSSVLLVSSPNSKVNFTTLLHVSQITHEILNVTSMMADSLGHTKGNNNADSISHFPNQNGITPNTVNYCTDVDDVGKEEEKGNACCAGSNFNEYDDDDTCNDESKSNEFSGNYLLNITLDNLKQIKEAVQKIQLVCSNK